MNFNEYQEACKRTANSSLTTREAQVNWALGLAGESGEYCEHIKKYVFHEKHLDKNAIKSELGDILYYLAAAASVNGLSLKEIAINNVDKLKSRYPDGFTVGGGVRDRGAEDDDGS